MELNEIHDRMWLDNLIGFIDRNGLTTQFKEQLSQHIKIVLEYRLNEHIEKLREWLLWKKKQQYL